ncbi:MAG: hypothetical protein Tp178MES00d2C33159091_34 [Prokaryotic dsDNA virus sp.]|nr:hypothetical protein [Thalassospira sp.]MAZ33886.1 hypothetical protein [Thalassospira sp.]MAZ34621.1 hypothetical protein [Thalassospira sp.]QDP60983.1 MAG: hypothetical protein Tp178MES00d2C33159091_34 [Prokaryotic dsDNA virus sp.]QDP64512.1 MAG: hypothetical protein Tp178SUR1139111_32 [Prokaryotic dsDNA virus sp.]|tara:strand:+ start:1453 stop:1704 length:252 start_codon:yes stop_codon:yes gene_type:complete
MLNRDLNPHLEVVYESPKGSKFRIGVVDGRLFEIKMLNGGVAPDICTCKYTNFKKAKAALDRYFTNNPKPVPREKSKIVDKTD